MYSRHRVAGYSIDHVIKFFVFSAGSGCNPGYHDQLFCHFFHAFPKYSVPARYNIPLASQIDTAHISINRYLIRLLTENDDADTLLEHRTNWNSFHPQNEFIIILIFFWNLLKRDIRFFYIIQRMNGCIVLQKFFRHLLRISSYC